MDATMVIRPTSTGLNRRSPSGPNPTIALLGANGQPRDESLSCGHETHCLLSGRDRRPRGVYLDLGAERMWDYAAGHDEVGAEIEAGED